MSAAVPPLIPGRRPPEGRDLFGRDEFVLSRAAVAHFGGARVLVTGAAGTLGSAVARRLQGLWAPAVYLLDTDPQGLDALAAELGRPTSDLVVADIRDGHSLRRVIGELAPEIVVHAAGTGAPGHDPGPAPALLTNVRGTQNVLHAAQLAGAGLVVHVSSDEAARPASVLGLSRRLAELVVAAGGQDAAGMRTMSVRVGPLLDGRVGLLQALARHSLTGEPVPLSHPEASCPVLTAADAAGLILEAAALRGPARTYVLDPVEHVAAMEFARYLAGRVGLPEPEFSYAPGDLDQAGLGDRAAVRRTAHPRVWSLPPERVDPYIAARLQRLYALSAHPDPAALREGLMATLRACRAEHAAV